MHFSQFQKKVQAILETELPSGESVVKKGRDLAGDAQIGRTTFMNKMGVTSELEYKRHCIRNGHIMYHAHIGMNTWADTADALAQLYKVAEQSGFVIDRAGLCLDRRMALPGNSRDRVPAETGPMLETHEQWLQLGSGVPIQPHMGDFMIGFPASVDNTIHALKSGVTTIGNLSQFFAHEAPMWRDKVTTTVETVKAMSIMGAMREKGTLVHSYLEDGYGALFQDCATLAGWAFLERYIVEELLNAKLAHCIGGLTSDPVKRTGWNFALHEIHDKDHVSSMVYGDTISFSSDFTKNRGLVAEYLMWDILAQLECPTGAAVHPLPVTEAVRIPSAEEIAEAQCHGRRIEETARRLWPHVDFSAAYEFSAQMCATGKSVFDNALDGFAEAGVDVRDPVQLLYLLKMLGPADFEEMFGAGHVVETSNGHRQPVVPTDVYTLSQNVIDKHGHMLDNPESKQLLKGRKVVLASTDVHAHAIRIIHELLLRAGMQIINLGAEVDPDKIARAAEAGDIEAILVSTHNGMALEYGKRLKAEMDERKINVPVVMGGVLNQKVEDEALPVDITSQLKELGFYPSPRLESKFRELLEHDVISKQ